MMRGSLVLCLLAAGCCSAAAAQYPADGDDHLVYGCADRLTDRFMDRPLSIAIDKTPKGPKVTVTLGGSEPTRYETLDVNFAHVSRRLFFKARTADGLIEFQGHARPSTLAGLFSDDHGRTGDIALPSASAPGPCATINGKQTK